MLWFRVSTPAPGHLPPSTTHLERATLLVDRARTEAGTLAEFVAIAQVHATLALAEETAALREQLARADASRARRAGLAIT